MTPEIIAAALESFTTHIRDSLGRSEHTVRAYTSDLSCFAHYLCERTAAQDNARAIGTGEDYAAWLRTSKHNAPATIRRKLATLQVFVGWMVQAGEMEPETLDSLRVPIKLPARLPRALAKHDVSQLIGSTQGKQAPLTSTTQLIVKMLIATGLRIGEACAINVADVLPDGSAIRVYGKGNRERTVFVSNTLLRRALAAHRKDRLRESGVTAPLFIGRTYQRLTPQAFRLRLHRLAASRRIDGIVTPHKLRHTTATLLVEAGVNTRIIQRLLGHASITTTEIYTHVADDTLRLALEQADPLRLT